MQFIKYHWKTIVWLLIIFLGSLLPSNNVPSASLLSQIPYFDKIVHFELYFVFTILLISGFLMQYPSENAKAYLISGALSFTCGLFIEVLQTIMQLGRSGDFYDVIANTTGIILALLLFKKIKRLFPWAL